MCNPLPFLAAAAGGIAQIGSGFANSDLAKFQAQLEGTNAQLAAGNAQLAADKGALDIGRTATSVNEAVASGMVRASASHLDPTFGSPLSSILHSVMQGQGDIDIINARTAQGVATAKAQEASAIGQQSSDLMKAQSDQMLGFLNAGSSVLGALSKEGPANDLKSLFSGLYGAGTSLLSSASSSPWPWQNGSTGAWSFNPTGSAGAIY
jgi:hypothetical protein